MKFFGVDKKMRLKKSVCWTFFSWTFYRICDSPKVFLAARAALYRTMSVCRIVGNQRVSKFNVVASVTCSVTFNEWKVMWMHCDKCNAVYDLQEKEYDKGDEMNAIQWMQCNQRNAINAMQVMQCDECNTINAMYWMHCIECNVMN